MSWWKQSQPVDPIGLKEAVTIVHSKLADDGTLRKNMRIILGWLQSEKVGQIADTSRLDLPMDVASRHDAFDRGVAKGIEEAVLVADPEQLGVVLGWLTEEATDTGDQ